MNSSRNMRWWLATLCVALPVNIASWALITNHFARFWIYVLSALLGLGLLAIWYAFLTGLPRKKKFTTFLALGGIGALAALLFVGLFKYDGSRDGSSLPRWAFRFGKEAPVTPPAPVPVKSPTSSPANDLPSDLRDAPTFLGKERDGVFEESIDPDWETRPPELLWRQPFGEGWASFAVAGRRAVTTAQVENDEQIICLDLLTGSPLWTHINKDQRFFEAMGGPGPRATPTIHLGKVYSLGGTGILDCLDLATGELLWSKNTLSGEGRGNITYAPSGAPLIHENMVIVSGGKNSGLLAFEKDTGEVSWEYTESSGAYASPRLVTLAGRKQLLHLHQAGVAGHDPSTGQRLWNFDFGGEIFPKVGQPLTLPGDRVLVTASYDMGTHLLQIEQSPDSHFNVTPIWESSRMKTKFSSGLLIGDHLYGIDSGRFACISLEDGERAWKDGRYGFGQNIRVGSHILVQAERGNLVLIAPDPDELTELATFPAFTSGKCWTPPVVAGAYCLVRSETEIACVKLPLQNNKEAARSQARLP